MRIIAIGDIHGCFDALSTLDENAPISTDDMIVTVGDHIDRGPKSGDVLDWLIERHGLGKLVALKGNHEIMLLQAAASAEDLTEWLKNGGDSTLRSYAGNCDSGLATIPTPH